jgi:hypothetical protein
MQQHKLKYSHFIAKLILLIITTFSARTGAVEQVCWLKDDGSNGGCTDKVPDGTYPGITKAEDTARSELTEKNNEKLAAKQSTTTPSPTNLTDSGSNPGAAPAAETKVQTSGNEPAPPGGNSGETAPDRLSPEESLGMEYTPEGINNQFNNSKQIVSSLNTTLSKLQPTPATAKFVKDAQAYVARMTTLATEIKECNESAMGTASACFESGNSGIQGGMAALSQLLPMVGMMSMNDTCSAFSKIMTVLNGAMGVFQAQCAFHKNSTEKTCQESLARASKLKSDAKALSAKASPLCPTLVAPAQAADKTACEAVVSTQNRIEEEMNAETDRGTKYTPAYGMKIAAGKEILIANTGANILQVAGTIMSGQKCDKQSAATTQADICQQYPNVCVQPSPVAVADYCVTNPNDITCICSKNVNDPACSGSRSIDPGGSSSGSTSLDNPADPNFSLDGNSDLGPGFNPVDPNGLANGGNGNNTFGGADGSSTGSSGAGAGGTNGGSGYGSRGSGGASNLGSFGSGSGGGSKGGGGGGLGSGFSSGAASGGGSGSGYGGGSGFNTDIAHEGGAGAGMAGGDGSRKPSTEDLLKAFLPGGDKDPKKAGAGPDGLTGAAGLSIFQKVTRGYQRNAKSLIPE